MPGSSSEVFHIRFTPCGAFIAMVSSAGSLKCETAVAVYRTNQVAWSTSAGVTGLVEASRVDPQAATSREGAGDVAYIVMAWPLDIQASARPAPRLLR